MNRVLNIGSINIDYVYNVPHFVQAGETLSSLSLASFPGGKGLNQSIALSRAGCRVYHAGKCAEDGKAIVQTMADAGVDTSFVDFTGTASGHAIIQVDETGQNCILLHKGANHEMDRAQIESILNGFEAGDVLVIQNEINELPFIMRAAHARGLKIAFNPSPFTRDIFDYPLACVTWFFINEVEGRELMGKKNHSEMLGRMLELYPDSTVILTVGKNGVLYRRGNLSLSHGIYDVPVVDTTAAGDTFCGFFIGRTLAGDAPEEALRIASVASSIAVSRKGAGSSIPKLDEVLGAKLRIIV